MSAVDALKLPKVSSFELLKIFLVAIAPISLAIGFFVTLVYRSDLRAANIQLRGDEMSRVREIVPDIGSSFRSIVADLTFLAMQNELQEMLDRKEPEEILALQQAIAQEYLHLAQYKNIYDRICFIDTAGNERICIAHRNGAARILAEDRLQNRRALDWYRETAKLAKRQVYASPFDLDLESDDRQPQPVIRFGLPIFDRAGVRRGAIVLNYSGKLVFEALDRRKEETPGKLLLAYSDGYWLRGPQMEDELGSARDERSDRTFWHQFPKAWQLVSSDEEGQFQTVNGLFSFATLRPLLDSDAAKYSSSYHWKLVSHVDPESLRRIRQGPLQRALILGFSLWIVAIVISGSIARSLAYRRSVRQTLERSERRYRSLVLVSSEIAWTASPYGVMSDASSWQEFTGQSSEQACGYGWLDALHLDDRMQTADVWRRAVIEKSYYETEYRVRSKTGEYRYMAVRGVPVLDEAGNVCEWVGSCTDIHDRKLAETVLRKTLAHLNAIITNLADGLLVANTQGRIVRYNPTFLEMFDLSGVELANKSCRELDREPLEALADLIERTGSHPQEVQTIEVNLSQQRIGQAVATKIYEAKADNDVWLGSAILIRDVTSEKEVDRMKTDFISTVSHELRTPLTSVLGFTSLVREKLEADIFPLLADSDRKVQKTIRRLNENLNIIVAEAERLTALINDVLDIAKMESGKIEWDLKPIDLADTVNRALTATASLFEGTSLALFRDIATDLPPVIADRDRIIQVAINLISNAVKFTDRGCITCRVARDGDWAVVSVTDTGIGIAPGDREKIFEKFKQVGETLTEKPKGTGLGLPICKQIVEYHGGRIWVESEFGRGSAFFFALPFEGAQEATSPSSQAAPQIKFPIAPQITSQTTPQTTPQTTSQTTPQTTPAATHQIGSQTDRAIAKPAVEVLPMAELVQQLRDRIATTSNDNDSADNTGQMGQRTILIVDDDRSIRELLRQSLETAGYAVREAKDGFEAIAEIKIQPPDLILLDVMMPQMSGFDVAAVLKSDPNTSTLPIVVLSIVEDRERGYRLGIDRYLTKPINTEELLGSIGVLLAQGSSDKKVLVVDRNASTVQTLSEVLQAQGYQVCGASEGEECIQKAIAMQPSMIIVDSLLSQQHNLIQTLRFEKGLENVFFILLGDR